MVHARTALGNWGEEKACGFLRKHGFEILDRNYHSTKGEIDIVASKGGDYYFIEVKTRTEKEFANDLSITWAKKKKLEKTMREYSYKKRLNGGSLILAGLILLLNKPGKSLKFRFYIIY